MNPYPRLDASFWKSAKPLRFSSLEMAEYRDELIDFDVGIISGGIFGWLLLSIFYLSLPWLDGLAWL